MKLFKSLKSAAFTILLGTMANVAAQGQTSEGCDLSIWQVLSPQASALSSQPVKFIVWNNGETVSHFKAGVKINGETVCEKEFNETVEKENIDTLDLGYTVECPYGQTTAIKVFVHADGDTEPTNDERDVNITMPRLLTYPYTWNEDTSKDDFTYGQFWGIGWGYDESEYKAFYMSGKATNWMGDLATLPIDFPADGKVTCSFDYGTSGGAVDLTVVLDYGDKKDTLQTVELEESTQGFSPGSFSFNTERPAIVRITAKLCGAWNAYGSIYLRNICFKDAVKDLMTKKILSPSLSQMAVSKDPIPVKVAFRNISPFDIENPTFCYTAGDDKVEEVYEGTIKGGETLNYQFTKGLKADQPQTITLKAWCNADGDNNKENDEVSKDVTFYEAVAFPYSTTFDEGNDLWQAIDNNNDGSTWSIAQMTDGNSVAAFTNSQSTCNDMFVSPAISMPQGKARVSFYYAGVLKAGTVNLRLYMNTIPSTEGAELLFDNNVTNGGWLNGYKALDIKEAGNRYFIFDVTGSGDQIVIDKFKVDTEEDLCINKVTFDTKSGYNRKTAKVTISYINHGMTPQKDVKVRYYINDVDHFVDETVADAVEPGDTIYYTFKKEADISATDSTYQLIGQIMTKVGEDTQNDMTAGDVVENYKVENIPYYYAFNDQKRNSRWLVENGSNPNSAWNIENFWYAYDGSYDLKHVNYSGEASDDWAYSECLHLPAGKYDVSLFYRGRTYFSGEEYNQSFEVKMGKDRTPEAMTIEIGKSDNEDIYQPAYRKMGNVVEITEDGDYFIGFHSTSVANQGETHIDAVSVKPIEEARTLPFESDFANDSISWTWYNANATQFTKWSTEDGKAILSRNEDEAWNYFEGLLVSPKLAVTPGKKIKVEMKYNVTCDNDSTSLQLYGGKVNNPANMEKLVLLPAKNGEFTYEFTPADDETEYYIGFRSNTDPDDQDNYYNGPFYKIELQSVKVNYSETTGITDTSDNGFAISANNGTLAINSGSVIHEANLYDAMGKLLATCGNGTTNINIRYGNYKGVAILKVKTANGNIIKKLSL